jgi:hypothetical protein
MKPMTCRQLGGRCELAHHAVDHDEIIKAEDRHLRQTVESGSTEHEPALEDLKARWRRPISGLKWYRSIQRNFAALPEEA